MQRLLLFILVFACAAVQAQVYKRVGPDGEIYFSDRAGPDAEQVEVAPAPAIRLLPSPAQTDAAVQPGEGETESQEDPAPAYTGFSIVSPGHKEALRANDGNVTVRLSILPDLLTGHTIALKIDGEDEAELTTSDAMAVDLTNLSRGRHTVEATVLDEEGNAVIKAGPVTFKVLRVAVGGR